MRERNTQTGRFESDHGRRKQRFQAWVVRQIDAGRLDAAAPALLCRCGHAHRLDRFHCSRRCCQRIRPRPAVNGHPPVDTAAGVEAVKGAGF